MADLSGTGSTSRPHVADERRQSVDFTVAVNDGDTYTPSFFQSVEDAIFMPTASGITCGVTISGKTITVRLSGPVTGTLIWWGK